MHIFHNMSGSFETGSTNGLKLARTQIGTWTHVPGLPVSGLTEVQVLHVSVQKEFSERQSDKQEIDLLR